MTKEPSYLGPVWSASCEIGGTWILRELQSPKQRVISGLGTRTNAESQLRTSPQRLEVLRLCHNQGQGPSGKIDVIENQNHDR